METFDVSGEDVYAHGIGDAGCHEGWCGNNFFPTPCVCGGLIHADFGDDTYDGYWLYEKCDRCGVAWVHKEAN
jgi:hypothetical protein